MELADLDGVPARACGYSRLFPVPCKISHHPRRAVGELAYVRSSRVAALGGSREGLCELRGLPRKDRRPNPRDAESWSRGFLRIRNIVCFAPTAGSSERAQSWGESTRVYACRYQWKYGGDVRAALRADAGNGRTKTTRVAFGFLLGILVTVLQLRVAGYSE